MPRPPLYGVTADVVLLTVRAGAVAVLMVQRKNEPFQGRWALPGGFVDPDEDLPDAALRELAEETGIRLTHADLTDPSPYGRPGRDPRGRTITIAYVAVASDLPDPVAADDAAAAAWRGVTEVLSSPLSIAFDHEQILLDALERARPRLDSMIR